MRTALRLSLILGGLAALAVHSCFAIDPHRVMSQYVRDRWGAEQGFPRGPVYAIAQTADGYLWIGTEAGLVRFDGLRFVMVQDPSHRFAFTSVIGLAADNDGSLWLRLRDLTLLRYRKGEFNNPFSDPGGISNITAMARTGRGELLAAKMQMGAFTYKSGSFALVAGAKGVPRSPVIAVAITGDGTAWLGTRGAGLFQLKGGNTASITRGLPDPKINCLLPDGAQDLWVGTDNGLARWNGSQLTSRGMPALATRSQILTLAKDRDANLWLGTDSKGLLRFNTEGIAALDPGEGEAGNAVTALFEDREGNIWIGSANGIERLRDSPFVTYSGPEGVPTDGSNPVFVDAENRAWFSPVAGGLWWFKDGRHGSIREAGLRDDVVYSITGGTNDLWLGRQRGGLTRLLSERGAFTARTYTKADGLAQDSVYSVYLDRSGVVWAGTLSGGVSRLDHGKFTTYTMAEGMASNTVASILESTDGAMWFATPAGLSSFAKGRWQTFTSAQGLPSENVNCLLEDSAGILWAGTALGLAFRSSGRFATPVGAPAALREQVLGLAEDALGSLWMATSNHVLRVNRSHLLSGKLADGDVLEYGLADGLRGTEGIKRHRSVITDPLGRIWMSLNHGISVVDPARLTGISAPAIPHIQTIAADGVPIEIPGPVRIPAGSRRMMFSYTGLSLSVPERVRFRYRLEGFDRGWSEPLADREAVYTNLGPGSYRFRVAASNPSGVWSSQEAALPFVVDPAFWQTWWFRAVLMLVGILTAVALYRLRLRHATARLRFRFEERLAERTRIAQELHDTLLQGFLSVSMQVHVAADCLPADSHAKPAFTRSLELMRQVIEEGRNAVRGLRSTPSASMNLEEAFSQLQNETSAYTSHPVDFRVISEGPQEPLDPVLRDEVYRIGREALLNAFRHAEAKKIEIELKYSPNLFRVVIRDDGRGIDAATLKTGCDGHWGLTGMRERADRMGAKLRLWSASNSGTEVELTVPGHIAFQQRQPGGREHRLVKEKAR